MAENGSIPISDGSSQNGAGSEAEASSAQEKGRTREARGARAFTFSTWLLEGVAGLCEELQQSDLGLPREFWTHAYAARREALLAARTLLDAAIARCEPDTSGPSEESGSQRGRVDIE